MQGLWLAGWAGVFALTFLSLTHVYKKQRDEQSRGIFVSHAVQHQIGTLSSSAAPVVQARTPQRVGSNDSPELFVEIERWLVSQLLRGEDPDLVVRRFDHFLGTRVAPPAAQPRVKRVRDTVARWGYAMRDLDSLAVESLLREGRQRYFDASGYRKQGQLTLALPLYLWSISYLTQFIKKNPMGPEIPEVLFLLGDAYLRLRTAPEDRNRGERLLNLCSELYPDSIWARQANSLRFDEMTHGT